MQSLETKSSRPRPRRDLRPSRPRPRLHKMGLETRLETETASRDSITSINAEFATLAELSCYSGSCVLLCEWFLRWLLPQSGIFRFGCSGCTQSRCQWGFCGVNPPKRSSKPPKL